MHPPILRNDVTPFSVRCLDSSVFESHGCTGLCEDRLDGIVSHVLSVNAPGPPTGLKGLIRVLGLQRYSDGLRGSVGHDSGRASRGEP